MIPLYRIRELSLPVWTSEAAKIISMQLVGTILGVILLNEMMLSKFPGMESPIPTVKEVFAILGV